MQIMIDFYRLTFNLQPLLHEINHVLVSHQRIVSFHYVSITLIKVYNVREILYMKFPAEEELIGTVDMSESGF